MSSGHASKGFPLERGSELSGDDQGYSAHNASPKQSRRLRLSDPLRRIHGKKQEVAEVVAAVKVCDWAGPSAAGNAPARPAGRVGRMIWLALCDR
jgi:hypothetical protein